MMRWGGQAGGERSSGGWPHSGPIAAAGLAPTLHMRSCCRRRQVPASTSETDGSPNPTFEGESARRLRWCTLPMHALCTVTACAVRPAPAASRHAQHPPSHMQRWVGLPAHRGTPGSPPRSPVPCCRLAGEAAQALGMNVVPDEEEAKDLLCQVTDKYLSHHADN